MQRIWVRSFDIRRLGIGLSVFAVVAIAATLWYRSQGDAAKKDGTNLQPQVTHVSHEPAEPSIIEFPRVSWDAAGLKLAPVQQGIFEQSVELTGKVALNEDRIAHVFPLIDGRVEAVKVQLGQKVKEGDLLVVVQSTEVGRSMLQLYQDRLQRDFAATKDGWTQLVARNTQKMIGLMHSDTAIEEIEKQLKDHPLGDYREKLMTAYVASRMARKTLDRVQPLSKDGAVAGKQLLSAEAEWNAARAALQSLLEQYEQEVKQAAKVSAQSVQELETRVAVDETNLKVLGFDDAALKNIDPVKQGEAVAHYPIKSPFDGTIISKDVVLLERVGPQSQILSIADLSTVWVTTDIYEEHLPLLKQLEERTIHVRNSAWPDKVFDARIFYTGDVVHESSRTVSMRAVADNREGLLKPGMFVNVELPNVARQGVLQVPLDAVQEHSGKTFVFVHLQGDQFVRRDVTLGQRNSTHVEVTDGLKVAEEIVVGGGFALKSQMLAELLAE